MNTQCSSPFFLFLHHFHCFHYFQYYYLELLKGTTHEYPNQSTPISTPYKPVNQQKLIKGQHSEKQHEEVPLLKGIYNPTEDETDM